jgi:hypothetical protein
MFDYPLTLVTTCYDPDKGKAKEDIFEQPHVPDLITGPPHTHAGTSPIVVVLTSARECVEPKSYRAALDIAHAPQWQAAMQHEYSSLRDNGTWELVDLPLDRGVVNNGRTDQRTNGRISGGTRVLELRRIAGKQRKGRALARRRSLLMRSSKAIEVMELDTNNEEDSRGDRSGTVLHR